MSKFIRLSYDIEQGMPVFSGNPENRIEAVDSFEKGATFNSYRLTLFNHNGTHIDAPKHFDRDGRSLAEYGIDQFIFERPQLVELDKKAGEETKKIDLEKTAGADPDCDLLIIRTGFWRERGKKDYVTNNPWIGSEAAAFIRLKFRKLKALAVDTVSIAAFSNLKKGGVSHQILLKKGEYESEPVLLIEDANLGILPKKFKRIFAVPLFICDIDSAPCTLFAEVEE